MITINKIFEFVNNLTLAIIFDLKVDDYMIVNNLKDAIGFINNSYGDDIMIRLFNINHTLFDFNKDEMNTCINNSISEYLIDNNVKKFYTSLLRYYEYDEYRYNKRDNNIRELGMVLNVGDIVYTASCFSLSSIIKYTNPKLERGSIISIKDNNQYIYYVLCVNYNPFDVDIRFNMLADAYREIEAVAIPIRKRSFKYCLIDDSSALHTWDEYTVLNRKILSKKKLEIVQYLDSIDNNYFYCIEKGLNSLNTMFFKKKGDIKNG